ncbi:hypothetical protein DL93DRAFT_2093958 [Clavulina sp. PMI_390]|nr:hypothetical protein DL93DRAFT_2093958 [Clavulina sp. PMI_390]
MLFGHEKRVRNKAQYAHTMPFSFRDHPPQEFNLSAIKSPPLKRFLKANIETYEGIVVDDDDAVSPNTLTLVDPRYEYPEEIENAVCYTYIRACIEGARRALDKNEYRHLFPIFVHSSGEPLNVYFEDGDPNKVGYLLLVTMGGGIRNPRREDCDIILTNGLRSFPLYQSPYVRIHPFSWVAKCIEQHQMVYDMSQQISHDFPRRRAQPFTDEDIENLARYIASHFPSTNSRGRKGEKLYKDLCANPEEYPWAERHTWQSWQTHFKKNPEKFEPYIKRYVKKNRKLQFGNAISVPSPEDSESGEDVPLPDDLSADDDDVDEGEVPQRSSPPIEVANPSPPTKKSKSRRKTVASKRVKRGQNEDDVNDFGTVREGDDSAPPQWARGSSKKRASHRKGKSTQKTVASNSDIESEDEPTIEAEGGDTPRTPSTSQTSQKPSKRPRMIPQVVLPPPPQTQQSSSPSKTPTRQSKVLVPASELTEDENNEGGDDDGDESEDLGTDPVNKRVPRTRSTVAKRPRR